MTVTATISSPAKRRLPGASSALPGLRLWTCIVFSIVLAAELVGAYFLIYRHGYVFNDALSRTANAFFVLNITPPKLASIGFVWNPLPSLLQIPIVYFKDLWRPLASSGMAGCILTSIFAAANASLLFRYFRTEGNGAGLSLLIAALYAFNPFIFFYGCNGMSETIFFTALIVGTYNFAMWMDDRVTNRLLAVALMLAMAFLTRYETFAWIMGFAVSLVIVVYMMKDRRSPFNPKPVKMKMDYLTGTGAVMFVPVAYTILIWLFLCLTIMGDPLFFLRSAYSNESQSTSANFLMASAGHYYDLFIYTIIRMFPFLPPFIVLFAERTMTKRLFKADMLVYILLTGCVVGFHYMLLLRGRSFGWLRFFSYILPATIAWFPYELTRLTKKAKTLTVIGLIVGLTVVSPPLLLHYFKQSTLAREEWEAFRGNPFVACQTEMAQIINTKYGNATLLFDSFTTSFLIINLDRPENIITTTSDDFDKAVKNPMGYNVDYILTTVNSSVGALDAINREYPDIFDNGTPWTELVEDVHVEGASSWTGKDTDSVLRLYKVIPW